jgi:outer membrane usher protein
MRIRLLALLVLLSLPVYAYGSEKAVLKVYVNTEEKGEYFFILDGGRILISIQDLLDMGFTEVSQGAAVTKEGYITLDSLSPGVSFTFDEKTSALRLTVDPKLLKKNTIDLSQRRTSKVLFTADTAAFLNYGVTYSAGNDFDFSSLAVPLEISVSKDGYLGLSTFSYIKNDTDNRFVRLLSSITRDDPARLRRFIIGDVPAFSGMLGSGGTLGGVSVSTNFSMSPFLVRSPGLDITGMAQTPSDVEVYANGMLVKKEHVAPGQFEFLNLPNLNGAGEVSVVIKDAFGQEQRLYIPYYLSSQLLKPGLQEYSYNLGLQRRELGTESFNYGDPAFVAFHRVGFSPAFTGGLRAEADKDVVNVGPTATFLLGNLGELDTGVALSRGDGRAGYGYFSNYFYAGRYFSGRISARGFSRDYANLTLTASSDKPRFESSVGVGVRQKELGSLSLSYGMSELYQGADLKRASAFYSRPVLKNASLNISASRTDADKRVYEIFALLTVLLGKETSGSLGYSAQDDAVVETVAVQQNPPLGTGWGYRLFAERRENDQNTDTGGDAAVQYRGPFGIYSADYRRNSGQNSYNLSASGGIAYINHAAYLARPITDGFALVKVGGVENVRVNYNNQEVGTTGKNGELLVPGLIGYNENNISINDQDIPVNYSIAEMKKLISIPYRGGGVVRFDLTKLQGFTGRLFIIERGRKIPAEYWGLEVRIHDQATEAVVGKGGEFYLENIPAGRFPARLFMKERECRFELTIPQSDETMVNMGGVVCEMD